MIYRNLWPGIWLSDYTLIVFQLVKACYFVYKIFAIGRNIIETVCPNPWMEISYTYNIGLIIPIAIGDTLNRYRVAENNPLSILW